MEIWFEKQCWVSCNGIRTPEFEGRMMEKDLPMKMGF
jgi:hypothetical protein